MRLHYLVLPAVLASLLLCGCKSHSQTTVSPADQAAFEQVRQTYTRVDPGAKVGRVIAVLHDDALAAVGDVNPADFSTGDVMVFTDSSHHVIAVGHVVNKTVDAVHLNYDVKADGRAPDVGDFAVKTRM